MSNSSNIISLYNVNALMIYVKSQYYYNLLCLIPIVLLFNLLNFSTQ